MLSYKLSSFDLEIRIIFGLKLSRICDYSVSVMSVSHIVCVYVCVCVECSRCDSGRDAGPRPVHCYSCDRRQDGGSENICEDR